MYEQTGNFEYFWFIFYLTPFLSLYDKIDLISVGQNLISVYNIRAIPVVIKRHGYIHEMQ